MNPSPAKPPAKSTVPPPEPVKKTFSLLDLDSKKLRLVLLGALGLSVLLFVGILALGSSALSRESQNMVGLKVKSQTAEAQLASLEQAKKQVNSYSFFKGVAQSVIPNDKDQATDIVEINNMANEAGIAIQSITFPASSLGLTTTTTATQDATSSSSSTAISQAKPVSGIPGLYSLELTITPESDVNTPADKQITFAKMLDFLNRIENNRHTAQITAVNITPAGTAGNSNKNLAFTITTNIFIKP